MMYHNWGLCRYCGKIHIHPKGNLNRKFSKEWKDNISKGSKDIKKPFSHSINLSKAKTGVKRKDLLGDKNPSKRKDVIEKIKKRLKERNVNKKGYIPEPEKIFKLWNSFLNCNEMFLTNNSERGVRYYLPDFVDKNKKIIFEIGSYPNPKKIQWFKNLGYKIVWFSNTEILNIKRHGGKLDVRKIKLDYI